MEGGEAIVQVNLEKENSWTNQRVIIQKAGKIKDASWWILVGDENTGQLHALKKVFFKTTLRKDIQLSLPESFEKSKNLTVFLISDSYLGLDQVYSVPLRRKESKHDEKFRADSSQDSDGSSKPIRQRLSDDEGIEKQREGKQVNTNMRFSKGNTLQKRRKDSNEDDSDLDQKEVGVISKKEEEKANNEDDQNVIKNDDLRMKQNQEINQKELAVKKKNIIQKKNRELDQNEKPYTKQKQTYQVSQHQGQQPQQASQVGQQTSQTSQQSQLGQQPSQKSQQSQLGQQPSQTSQQSQKMQAVYVKKNPSEQDVKRKKECDTEQKNRRKKYNDRRQGNNSGKESEDEYDIGYKTKEGSQIDELNRRRREENADIRVEKESGKRIDNGGDEEDIHEKIKNDSDFSEEEEGGRRNKRARGKRGGSNAGDSKLGNQLTKRKNEEGDAQDKRKPVKKFTDEDNQRQNRSEITQKPNQQINEKRKEKKIEGRYVQAQYERKQPDERGVQNNSIPTEQKVDQEESKQKTGFNLVRRGSSGDSDGRKIPMNTNRGSGRGGGGGYSRKN